MHIFIKPPVLFACPKCGKPILSHTACKSCGFYKGEEVVDVLKKLTKKERKQKEKEMAAKEATPRNVEPSSEKSDQKEKKKIL